VFEGCFAGDDFLGRRRSFARGFSVILMTRIEQELASILWWFVVVELIPSLTPK